MLTVSANVGCTQVAGNNLDSALITGDDNVDNMLITGDDIDCMQQTNNGIEYELITSDCDVKINVHIV